MSGASAFGSASCGTFSSSTMIVMMTAITPSLNASSLVLFMSDSGLKELPFEQNGQRRRNPEDEKQDGKLLGNRVAGLRDADPHVRAGDEEPHSDIGDRRPAHGLGKGDGEKLPQQQESRHERESGEKKECGAHGGPRSTGTWPLHSPLRGCFATKLEVLHANEIARDP